MCGIIGYTGSRICKPFLLGGLERMEYRGYDSAGISLIEGDEVEVVRAVGNLSMLKQVARLHFFFSSSSHHFPHIGYTGARICKPFLIGGLERMEYRGYDSAGISLIEGDEVEVVRAVGNLSVLKQVAGLNGSPATTGIGHTRWATHGRPSEANAHPLRGCDDRFSVALNGIVENYVVLKQRLLADGHTFSSETDAEVVAHLLETHYDGDLVEAVRLTFLDLDGHFAFCVVSPLHPQMIVGARLQCPMVVGLGEGETFLASDVVAFLEHTREAKLVGDRELVVITPEGLGCSISTAPPSSATPRPSRGTPPPPRRAATRRSCSRRSTSSPTRCARPSASGSRAARSCSTPASPTSSCSPSTASRSPPAAPHAMPAWSAAS